MNNNKSEIDICLNKISLAKQHAFRTAFDQYYGRLCEYATRLIHDTQSAEDIATDSFLKLLERVDQFNAGDQIKNYLFTATNKTCKNYKRQKRIKDETIIEFDYISSLPQDADIEGELRLLLEDEIEKLPPQRKRILLQLYWEGRTSQEVAERMQLSRQTVINQKIRAFKVLRDILVRKFL
jgi:RNA polymerase sigma-70 factor (ECF subfamily)